jgi:endonuclease/exonuclease/phosphatase family metal-dependent hydrolase
MHRTLLLLVLIFLPLFRCPGTLAEELKIATWNLEWLTTRPAGDPGLPADITPKKPEDIARLRKYADVLAADLVAFQGVDGPEVAAQVFTPDRYAIHTTGDPVVQRVGLAVRRGLHFIANPDLAGLDLYPNARHRLRSGADITLELPRGQLRVLAVHLKTGCRQEALTEPSYPCETLRGQLAPLRAWISQRQAEGTPFVLLGDFNRWMDVLGGGGNDPFFAAMTEVAPLARATAGRSSPCWGGGRFIDHIVAGGPARTWMQPDTLRVLVYRETGTEWRKILSDHCPVSVRFHVPE